MAKIFVKNFIFQPKRKNALDWAGENPVLREGEFGIVTDGSDGEWLKVGDGHTAWNSLPYKKGAKGKDGYTPILGVDYFTIDQNTEYVFDGGNADQSVPTVIMVDEVLSENSINAVMNKAVTKKLLNLDNKIEHNTIRNLSERYILFIGDSYACDWGANSQNGWCQSCITQILAALGKESDSAFRDEHYATIKVSGVGFSEIDPKYKKNVYNHLKSFVADNADFMSKVTDIVFALGYNDAKKAVRAGIDPQTVATDIKNNINYCNNIINQFASKYVNKYLFAVGWGSNPTVRYAADFIYRETYSYAAKLGWVYSDLRYVMYNSKFYYESDWVHPNKLGSDEIACRILNTLLGNSSITAQGQENIFVENGNVLGRIDVLNNYLVSLFLGSSVLYESESTVTLNNYERIDIKIPDFIPFGHLAEDSEGKPNVPYTDILPIWLYDKSSGTYTTEYLNCTITKQARDGDDVNSDTCRYDSYFTVYNFTQHPIKFDKLYTVGGVMNIHVRL